MTGSEHARPLSQLGSKGGACRRTLKRRWTARGTKGKEEQGGDTRCEEGGDGRLKAGKPKGPGAGTGVQVGEAVGLSFGLRTPSHS